MNYINLKRIIHKKENINKHLEEDFLRRKRNN